MSGATRLDGRRARELDAELRRRALAVLSGDGRSPPLGEISEAILAVAARIGEEVTRRLDMAPAKQADNFYTAAGIGRDPARPATVPVAFVMAEGAKGVASAPARTQLMVDADGPVVFETETRIDLAPGTIAALRGLDARKDAIAMPSAAMMASALPHGATVARRLRSGAAAGATKIQIDPAAGLAPGALLRLGAGDAAREYLALAVEGDLVTIEPGLESALAENSVAVEAGDFAPFSESARNHQSHALYLGHATLLDIPSAVTITVTGTALPADAKWSWWGQLGDDDPPAWQALIPNDGATLSFTKAKGKPAKKKIGARESLWLRADLPGKSLASGRAQNVRIAIGDASLCTSKREKRCKENLDAMNVGYEAIANTTPLVTNRAFHPFGREPRLYDSFYIGSDEAFSKSGAEISLCFELGGADLGPLAVVTDSLGAQVFAVGTGGVAYRADFRGGGASLMPLPPPTDQTIPALSSQAAVDAWSRDGQVQLAVASPGAVHVASLAFDSRLDQASVAWTRHALETEAPHLPIRQVAISGGPAPIAYALEGAERPGPTRLWMIGAPTGAAEPVPVSESVSDLVAAQWAAGDPVAVPDSRAVLWIEEGKDGSRLVLRSGARTFESPWFRDPNFPLRCRTAFIGSDLGILRFQSIESSLPEQVRHFAAAIEAAARAASPSLFIAGYGGTGGSGRLQLVKFRFADGAAVGHWQSEEPVEALPVTFTLANPASSSPLEQRLQLSVALDTPRHFHIAGAKLVGAEEPKALGLDDNEARMLVSAAGKTFVQRSNAGLRYRAASDDGGALAEQQVQIAEQIFVASNAQLPASRAYAVFGESAPQGSGFVFSSNTGAYRRLEALTQGSGPAPDAEPARYFLETGPPAEATRKKAQQIDLAGDPPGATVTILLAKKDSHGRRLSAGIWQVERVAATKAKKPSTDKTAEVAPASTKWQSSQDLPEVDSRAGETLEYVRLDTTETIALVEAVALTTPGALTAPLQAGPLYAATSPPTEVAEPVGMGSAEILLLPHDLVEDQTLRLFREPQPWRDLGPSQPANPALSWEYWNGESWWALAARELVDQTANFQQSGGVFFTVPPDIQPTEVAGRNEHWLRVRLAGGDYGEAKVTVVGQPGARPNTTEQIVVRDVSTVRAPYIASLRLGYCAIEPVRPETVLTEDSLGAVDQTSANEAGLAFPVFTPVAELMNPVGAAEATAAADAAAQSCDDPCPESEPDAPSPCDAPGACESCDSPCIAPAGYRSPAGEEPGGFVRGIMIGFSKPFAGNTISLYVDADPAGPPAELEADILRGGRFVPVDLVRDSSYGLTEPGILTLALPGPPDTSDLFGASAHWLRLRPKGDAEYWAPRLRGIHLNAVLARSIETRAMEQLGQSIGVADQLFHLTEAPVDPRSLELRVRELLADEEKADPALDVVDYAAGPAGDWVRWQATEDLVDSGAPGRVFMLDAEAGLVRFGDGATGRIPPLGADILAAHYAHVIGRKANAVAAGDQLQTLSPLAGVERALALDNAAGGSDSEALESARRRAAAKVRHGGRILSRADLEDHVLTLSPGIAQVRAETRYGGTRLVVAMAGPEARPSPAQLREFAAAIREVAGFGLARPGGLKLAGPRLLPLAVDLVLRPLAPDLFAEAAVQARAALEALFDPATGNHDGKGWPLGRLPDRQDIAAALAAIEALALPESVTLERADKEVAVERALPASIPSDVLVRLDGVAFERAREEAA